MTNETRRLHIPYPSDGQDPYYPAFDAMVKALDAIGFSDVSDRNTLLYGGGEVSWDDSEVFFTQDISFVEPSYGQRQVISPLSAPLNIPSAHFLYTELSRGTTSPVSLEPMVGSGINLNINTLVLAWHNPDDGSLIWRSGARQIPGEVIGDVGNSAASDAHPYLLISAAAQLPNSRRLSPASGIELTDEGPQGNLTIGLSPSGVAAGDYTFASFTVDESGRITEAVSNPTGGVTNRVIDIDVEPNSAYFSKLAGGGVSSGTSIVPTAVLADAIISGVTSHFMALTYESNTVSATTTYTTRMRYPFRIPTDAATLDSATLFVSCSGSAENEVLVELIHNDVTYSAVKSLAFGQSHISVSAADLGLSSITAGARCVLSVRCTNDADPLLGQYVVAFGPISLTFPNFIAP